MDHSIVEYMAKARREAVKTFFDFSDEIKSVWDVYDLESNKAENWIAMEVAGLLRFEGVIAVVIPRR